MRGVRAEERVQRIDADEVGPAPRRVLDQLAEVGEVADAPVALGAERVELGCHAPGPQPRLQALGLEAAHRCDDQRAVGRRQRVDRRAKLVIAAGNVRREGPGAVATSARRRSRRARPRRASSRVRCPRSRHRRRAARARRCPCREGRPAVQARHPCGPAAAPRPAARACASARFQAPRSRARAPVRRAAGNPSPRAAHHASRRSRSAARRGGRSTPRRCPAASRDGCRRNASRLSMAAGSGAGALIRPGIRAARCCEARAAGPAGCAACARPAPDGAAPCRTARTRTHRRAAAAARTRWTPRRH